MKAVSMVENGDFFERRRREGFAEGAEEVWEKEYKIKKTKINNLFFMHLKKLDKFFFLGFPLVPSFLRPLRNLRVLCVQKFSVFVLMAINPLIGVSP